MSRFIFIIILLIAFLAHSCINQKVTEDVVFNPIKEYEVNMSFTKSRFYIPNTDSTKLEAWYLKEDNAKFNFIYLSGSGSNIRSAIPFFNELGKQLDVNIFSFNYSGYGLSEGKPSIEGIVNDGNTALNYYDKEIGDKGLPTIVLGYSLGGFVALSILENKVVDRYVLMSTFTSLEELQDYLIKDALPGIVRPFLKLDIDPVIYNLDNIKQIQNVSKPVLFVHGNADKFIPPKMSEKLYSLSISKNKEFVTIDEADHRMVLKDPEKNKIVIQEIKKFIEKNPDFDLSIKK